MGIKYIYTYTYTIFFFTQAFSFKLQVDFQIQASVTFLNTEVMKSPVSKSRRNLTWKQGGLITHSTEGTLERSRRLPPVGQVIVT